MWFSRGDGTCAAHLASVPVAGGKERSCPARARSARKIPLPRPGRPEAPSPAATAKTQEALVVGDLRGLEGYGQTGLRPVAWSRDRSSARSGRRRQHARPRHQQGRRHRGQPGALPGPHRPRLPAGGRRVQPRQKQRLRRPPPLRRPATRRRSLVLLDKNRGPRKRWSALPRARTSPAAFDPTGRSLLYSPSPAIVESGATGNPPITLWLWRDGESRRVDRQTTYTSPAWLP